MKTHSIFYLMISFLLSTGSFSCSESDTDRAAQSEESTGDNAGLHVHITGEWLRTDGNYTLNVEKFNTDSTVNAFYYNPRPIHIAETRWKVQDDHVFFFIKFDDEGYPGSYYSLGYLPEEDRLYGFYYQAVMNQEFEVIFERK